MQGIYQKRTARSHAPSEDQRFAHIPLQFRDNRSETQQQINMQHAANDYAQSGSKPIRMGNNRTGLPDSLKSGIEHLSGYSMEDVKVHYNSSKPAQLQALAYAQGTQIHLAPGQEKHLGHEAWHVVQQKQGRVQATKQLKGSVNINDDRGLEREADDMGAKAMQFNVSGESGFMMQAQQPASQSSIGVVQRVIGANMVGAAVVNTKTSIIYNVVKQIGDQYLLKHRYPQNKYRDEMVDLTDQDYQIAKKPADNLNTDYGSAAFSALEKTAILESLSKTAAVASTFDDWDVQWDSFDQAAPQEDEKAVAKGHHSVELDAFYFSKEPMVTHGLGNCISVTAFDPLTKEAVFAHFNTMYIYSESSADAVMQSFVKQLNDELKSKKENHNIDHVTYHISLGGSWDERAKKGIEYRMVRKMLLQYFNIDADTLKVGPSAAFDPRNGNLTVWQKTIEAQKATGTMGKDKVGTQIKYS